MTFNKDLDKVFEKQPLEILFNKQLIDIEKIAGEKISNNKNYDDFKKQLDRTFNPLIRIDKNQSLALLCIIVIHFFIYILLCITDIFIPLGTNTVFFNEKIYIDIWYTFMCCIQAFALILFFDVCNKPNFVYINSILYTLLSSISGLTIIYMNYIPYLANDAYIQYCVFRCFFNLSSSIMLLLYSLYSYYL